jgi:hypothetical protein
VGVEEDDDSRFLKIRGVCGGVFRVAMYGERRLTESWVSLSLSLSLSLALALCLFMYTWVRRRKVAAGLG